MCVRTHWGHTIETQSFFTQCTHRQLAKPSYEYMVCVPCMAAYHRFVADASVSMIIITSKRTFTAEDVLAMCCIQLSELVTELVLPVLS